MSSYRTWGFPDPIVIVVNEIQHAGRVVQEERGKEDLGDRLIILCTKEHWKFEGFKDGDQYINPRDQMSSLNLDPTNTEFPTKDHYSSVCEVCRKILGK